MYLPGIWLFGNPLMTSFVYRSLEQVAGICKWYFSLNIRGVHLLMNGMLNVTIYVSIFAEGLWCVRWILQWIRWIRRWCMDICIRRCVHQIGRQNVNSINTIYIINTLILVFFYELANWIEKPMKAKSFKGRNN